MNKLISSCCKAKLWLCGSSRKYPKLDANDPDNDKKVERGRACYYECDKCKQECNAIGETLEIKNMEKCKWKVIDEDRACSQTQRLKVPGGYLYHRLDCFPDQYSKGEYNYNCTMCFVPTKDNE